MEDLRCVAIKASDGERCTRKHINGNTRCSVHNNFVANHGPNRTEILELSYIFKKQTKNSNVLYNANLTALGPAPWQNNREAFTNLNTAYNLRNRTMRIEYHTNIQTVRDRHAAEIARTGINPDAVQEERQRVNHIRLREQNQERMAAWREAQLQRHALLANQRNDAAQQPVVRGGLAGFANDRQNVHTKVAVDQTINTVKKILEIEVPSEYRWNTKTVSKTMSEVISECELSPASAWQMVAKYCSDESIYEMQPGIYGKVLDCVWQYIKNSPDKEDLKKILTSEMKDNIGMCAQGNLSRLTNILAGYVDCIVIEESMADKLGRLLPPLMMHDDIPDRLIAANRIFLEVGLPEDQWKTWAEVLISDQDPDDYREIQIEDGLILFIMFS